VPDLLAQLERARSLGFLGPGPAAAHLEHAATFVATLEAVNGRVIDLGSGGGVPGLVIACERPDLELVLVDAMDKRCRFLEQAVEALGCSHVTVVQGRAETLGRSELRGSAAAVVARSFGPPAVTAECAAPLLTVGGILVVSEPPEAEDRWPAAGVAELQLVATEHRVGPPALQILRQTAPCPERFPRRIGIPAKRPLF
jgi:16S rRNA (guanine527-N7)-methyltransferase